MPSITLEVPGAGDDITSGLHVANYNDIQTLLNGNLDDDNFASGKIFSNDKIMQDGASLGQALIWDGTNWSPGAVAGGSDIGDLSFSARRTKPDHLHAHGTAVSRSTYADLFEAIVPEIGVFTVTIASPGVFTFTSHGLLINDRVYLRTTGALPTGLAQNTLYYVVSTPTANTFTLSATLGGAAINTSGSQSGVHTMWFCPYGLGDGTTTFNLPDMRGRLPVGAGADATAHSKIRAAGQDEGAALANRQPDHFHASPIFQTGGSFNTGNILFNDAADGNSPTVNVGDTSGPQDGPAYLAGNWFVRYA